MGALEVEYPASSSNRDAPHGKQLVGGYYEESEKDQKVGAYPPHELAKLVNTKSIRSRKPTI